jgi:hypothetical protein
MWCIPPEQSAEFVCAMEGVLEVYQRPYDPDYPVLCMDEASKQLVGQTQKPLPPEPGVPQRYDYEYERHGTANIFMFTEPLGGCRPPTPTTWSTRHIAGGRKIVRDGLYMACLSAISTNPVLAPYYQQLTQRGLPHKTAMMACIRRMLSHLDKQLALLVVPQPHTP